MRCLLLLLALSVTLPGLAFPQSNEDRDAQPINPPVPSYPPMAAMFGIQGYCEVTFSVDEGGYPFSLSTSCTQPVFCYQSKRAISRVRFAPKIVGGQALPRFNVVYPLEYRMAEGQESIDRGGFKACDERAVS